jgi:hypothetical protein
VGERWEIKLSLVVGSIGDGVMGVGVGVGRGVGKVDGEREGGRYAVMFDSMGAFGRLVSVGELGY